MPWAFVYFSARGHSNRNKSQTFSEAGARNTFEGTNSQTNEPSLALFHLELHSAHLVSYFPWVSRF